MSFSYLKQLPTPEEIKQTYPLSEACQKIKQERDAEIARVLRGESDKFLVIIGPCSADKEEPVMDYIHRLAKINEQTKDKLIIIPRIYTNKPRTTGEGYKGIATQPDPEAKPDMVAGLIAVRKLHLRAIEETGLSAADEMLYPDNWDYINDLLSYVAIGARSVMLNSLYAAQHPHHFVHRGWEVDTTGNPLSHVILRGAVNKRGVAIPNYHYEDLIRLNEMYEKMDLVNPACIVDANHSNSNKKYAEQVRIVKEVMHNRKESEIIHKLVKGVMIESYICPGNQKIGEHIYGKSITDPCLGWEESEQLLYAIADSVK